MGQWFLHIKRPCSTDPASTAHAPRPRHRSDQCRRATAPPHHQNRELCAGPRQLYKVMPLRGYCLLTQDGREAPLLPGTSRAAPSRPYSLTFNDTCQMRPAHVSARSAAVQDDMSGVTATGSPRQARHGHAAPRRCCATWCCTWTSSATTSRCRIANNVFICSPPRFSKRSASPSRPVVGTTPDAPACGSRPSSRTTSIGQRPDPKTSSAATSHFFDPGTCISCSLSRRHGVPVRWGAAASALHGDTSKKNNFQQLPVGRARRRWGLIDTAGSSRPPQHVATDPLAHDLQAAPPCRLRSEAGDFMTSRRAGLAPPLPYGLFCAQGSGTVRRPDQQPRARPGAALAVPVSQSPR